MIPTQGGRSRRAKRETAKGRNRTRNAHFCRFLRIFADFRLRSANQEICRAQICCAENRRKPQIFAGNRRKPQIFTEIRNQEKGVLAKGVSAVASVTPKETKSTPNILVPAVHLALGAPQPREAYLFAKKTLFSVPEETGFSHLLSPFWRTPRRSVASPLTSYRSLPADVLWADTKVLESGWPKPCFW